MRLQKATTYGLYAVIELARDPARQLSAGDVADKYGISINHLAKVLRTLSRAGLIESVRGAGGGYRFAANPRRVTLLDIILLFEEIGPPPPRSREEGENTDIGRGLRVVLNEIDEIAQATLRSITLTTLLALIERQERARTVKERSRAAVANEG